MSAVTWERSPDDGADAATKMRVDGVYGGWVQKNGERWE